MKNILFFTIILSLHLSTLKGQNNTHKKISNSFNKLLKKKDIHNGFFQLKSTDGKLNWKFTGGTFTNGSPISDSNTFHSASIGKMFTASIIMMLVEHKKITLEDKIHLYLNPNITHKLHVFEGEDYSNKITIKQLLNHTSGLPDYLLDKPINGEKNLFKQIQENPNKLWEVEEILTFSKENLCTHFKPGTGYNYTDTEYILLGLIIEAIYKKPLHQVFTDELFTPLNLASTSMYKRSVSSKKTGKMAELYINDTEISTYNSLTIDWAGGGLVTTTEDLIAFQEALVTEEIINKELLQEMQSWIPESKGTYYGLGLRKYSIKEFMPLLPDLTLVGHTGSSASFSFYCPELDVYMAGTFNQTNRVKESVKFAFQTLIILHQEKSSKIPMKQPK